MSEREPAAARRSRENSDDVEDVDNFRDSRRRTDDVRVGGVRRAVSSKHKTAAETRSRHEQKGLQLTGKV